MAYTDYQKALKIGEKSYKTCVSNGSYPYLPVLVDMLSGEKPCAQVRLGLCDIPIELICGTYTAGRTTAFAWDFMPLLDAETEFAYKWSQLYDSLTADGQRDPIIAFEYMNRYYVVEGNKRVSVQKFLGAASVEGIVTRIVPPRTDSKENKVYYEFLDFYSHTKINYVLMSNEGSYEKLLHYIHPDADEPFTEDESLTFKFVFSTFRKEYEEKGGKKLDYAITIGDALLTYIGIFGYDEVRNKTSQEMHKDIAKIWSEFMMIADEKPFSVITDPSSDPQKLSLSRFIPGNSAPLKVAFVHYKEPDISGWSYCHELGKDHIENVFGDKISARSVSTYDSSDIGVLEKLIEDGFRVIFTTTPVLSDISLKCAVLHPDAIILNCSLNTAFRHLRTYYLRIYEAKFIIGAIAGILTQSNRIGYIADYPIFGMPASVNAFALGVKLVNPRASVYLDWSTLRDSSDPLDRMTANGVDIVSNRDITAPVQETREFGLYGLSGDSRYNIAMPVWHWGIMYESLVRSVLRGTWKNAEDGRHGLNYYWGMSSGAIDVIFSQKIPSGTRQLIWILMNQIRSGVFSPFSSEIIDQNGIKRNEDGNVMSPEEIVNMDWLTDNIIGGIPELSDLDETCRELIEQLGVKKGSSAGGVSSGSARGGAA